MRNLFFAVFALIVLAVAVGPVRGQDGSPPRDVPPPSIYKQRNAPVVAPLYQVLQLCHYRQVVSCPFTCDPTDDRACEVFLKMNGVVRDDRRTLEWRKR